MGQRTKEGLVQFEARLRAQTTGAQRDSWRELALRYRARVEALEAERAAAWRRLLDLSADEQLAAAMETIHTLRRQLAQLEREGENLQERQRNGTNG